MFCEANCMAEQLLEPIFFRTRVMGKIENITISPLHFLDECTHVYSAKDPGLLEELLRQDLAEAQSRIARGMPAADRPIRIVIV
jgi:hypothetical protein